MRRRLSLLLVASLVLVPAGNATANPGGGDGAAPGDRPGVAQAVDRAVDRAADRAADRGRGPDADRPTAADDETPQQAEAALETAETVLEGEAAPQDPSPTLALTDLATSLDSLEGIRRRQARALLARPDDPAARPSDGIGDRFGDGYTRPSSKRCSKHFCVHFTRAGSDSPPDRAWVGRNLRVLESVWRHHVGKLNYRRPLRDRGRGGNNKFDVYLKNVGVQGYYGYCAPERRPIAGRRLASGYCVLDNDFSRREFGTRPVQALRVTAAHEFFHAIQYNYDVAEDPWLMEASATWIEERFADGINDNRQFLSAGQVAKPGRPLDLFNAGSRAAYGNWAFFEFLSTRLGNGIVRQVWNRAADFRGAPDRHSVRAVQTALGARKQPFPAMYAKFAAANTIPGASYPEGGAWPQAPVSATYQLSGARRGTGPVTRRLAHLTARNVDLTRQRSAFSGARALRVRVDAPRRATGPAAHALVHLRNGKQRRRTLSLDRSGAGTVRLPFHRGVRKVTLTLANASGRYRCWQGRSWACHGVPRDDNRAYTFTATAVRTR